MTSHDNLRVGNHRLFVVGVVVLSLAATVGLLVWKYWYPTKKDEGSGQPFLQGTERTSLPESPKNYFRDITSDSGIKFVFVNGMEGKKILPETMGGGVAVLDYDRDGLQDLFFVNSCYWPGKAPEGKPRPTSQLYRNLGNNKFEDVSSALGLDVTMYGMGATVGDYDNDGWPDLYISGVGEHRLFHNEAGPGGGRKFVDVTAKSGDLAKPGGWPGLDYKGDFYALNTNMTFESSATWFDYDNDAKLDLFICCYVAWSPAHDLSQKNDPLGVGRIFAGPGTYKGSQCILYHNEGAGIFSDVTKKAGILVEERGDDVAKSLGAIVCDVDEDGWMDLIVANDEARNFYYHNQKDGTFKEVGISKGVAFAEARARGGMGVDWGEFRPGSPAALICNFSKEPNTLLCLDPLTRSFHDFAGPAGIAGPSLPLVKFGCFFFDYDLDGRMDILTNNGNLDPDAVRKLGETYRQEPQLFWNSGVSKVDYVLVPAKNTGPDFAKPIVGRGCAFGDFNLDGYPDVVLMDNGGPARVLLNEGSHQHHWLRLELIGDGENTNTSAIGAGVEVHIGSGQQTRRVVAGRGYLSQSELPITFGLGKNDAINRVVIRWNGKDTNAETVLENLTVDKYYRVEQRTGKAVQVVRK